MNNITFDKVVKNYVNSLRTLFVLADECSINDLKIVCDINDKFNNRLKALIDIRKEEEKNDIKTFKQLYNELSFNKKEK